MRKTITSICALLALALPTTAIASGANSSAQKHDLKMYKVEKSISLDAVDYDDQIDLSCDGSDIAVDGMWRVEEVHYNPQIHDFPFNNYDSVTVFRSFSVGESTWRFGVRNDTEDQAQLKLWATCLGRSTEGAEEDRHTHSFTVSGRHDDTVTLAADSVTELDAGDTTCDSDEIIVATGFDVSDAEFVKLYRSWPGDASMRSWNLGFYAPDDPQVTTSARCLKFRTSKAGTKNHRHGLNWHLSQFTTSLAPSSYAHKVKQSCGDLEKALIGAFDIKGSYPWGAGFNAHWLWFMGMEPQIKSRVFHVKNHHASASYNAKFGAICVNDRTTNRFFGP
jgi:hypothetical protein